MAIDHTKPPCSECGSYDAESHLHTCSHASRETLLKTIAAGKEVVNKYAEWLRRSQEQVTFWQGKFRIVKHENNKLRSKLRCNNQSGVIQ